MHIAVLGLPNEANSLYRAYQPMQALTRRGHEVLVNRKDRPLSPPELFASDVVHIHRASSAEMQHVAGGLRDAGVAITWDNDDNVTAMPKSNPLVRQRELKSGEMRAQVRAMVRLADIVTTPSDALAAHYRELGARDVRVIENHLPPEFDKVRPAKHRGVVITWLAALEHQLDYQELGLRDTLARLLGAHPDVRVLSIGLGLGLPAERYEHRRLVPYLQLAQVLSRCDLGIAPLADIPFNRARSNVKLKEYAAAGLPWLASPIGPYAGMGEQQGGHLVPDDGWYEALEQLVTAARERRKLAKRAMRWAKGEGIEQHAHRWEATLRDAIELARERRAVTTA